MALLTLLVLLTGACFISFVTGCTLRILRPVRLSFVLLTGLGLCWILIVSFGINLVIILVLLRFLISIAILVWICRGILIFHFRSCLCLGQPFCSCYAFVQLSSDSSLICTSSILSTGTSFFVSCSWINSICHLIVKYLFITNLIVPWFYSCSSVILIIFDLTINIF